MADEEGSSFFKKKKKDPIEEDIMIQEPVQKEVRTENSKEMPKRDMPKVKTITRSKVKEPEYGNSTGNVMGTTEFISRIKHDGKVLFALLLLIMIVQTWAFIATNQDLVNYVKEARNQIKAGGNEQVEKWSNEKYTIDQLRSFLFRGLDFLKDLWSTLLIGTIIIIIWKTVKISVILITKKS